VSVSQLHEGRLQPDDGQPSSQGCCGRTSSSWQQSKQFAPTNQSEVQHMINSDHLLDTARSRFPVEV